MSYQSKMEWRTGKEINAQIDLTIFKLQVRDYIWKKRLSIRPRRCYWTGNYIRPFSYAMVAVHRKSPFIDNAVDQLRVDDDIKKNSIPGWVAMPTYVFLKLEDKL